MALGRLTRLRRLSLRSCLGLTEGGLAYLPASLEELDLSHCRGACVRACVGVHMMVCIVVCLPPLSHTT